MKFLSLFIIIFIVKATIGNIQLTRYISNNGNNISNCGNITIPCESIDYSIQQIKSYGFSNFSIEILLESGYYKSQKPTNLYGLNISIGASNPNELVQFGVSSDTNVLSPQFLVEYPFGIQNILPTNVLIKDVTIFGCNTKKDSDNGYFFQTFAGIKDNVFLNVNIENVNFFCSNINSPYFTIMNNYGISSNESSSNSNDDLKEGLNEKQNIPFKSLENSNDSQGQNLEVLNQYFSSRPYFNDIINISFTFNNCQFGNSTENTYINNLTPVVFNSMFGFTVDLKITNSKFNSFYFSVGGQISLTSGGSFTMDNVALENITYIQGQSPFLSFSTTRVYLNQVNLTGTFSDSILMNTQNSILSVNQFNVLINFVDYLTLSLISFDDSFVLFENSSIIISFPSDDISINSGEYSIFNPENSNFYLFSNRISTNGSSVIYSQSSSVWANNNQFKYLQSDTYDFNLVGCDKADSNFQGDQSFIKITESCQINNKNPEWETLRVEVLSFFCGVLSMGIVFLIGTIISAIFKYRRNKKMKHNELLQLLPQNC